MELTHYLTRQELQSLNKDYVRDRLPIYQGLNRVLNRPVNHRLLNETKLFLANKPIPRPRVYRNDRMVIIRKGGD